MENKILLERILVTLNLLKMGDCWCQKGIDNPMFRDHTFACREAAELVYQAQRQLVKK